MEDDAFVNAAESEHLSVLATSFTRGKTRVSDGFQDVGITFEELTPRQILAELEFFRDNVDIPTSGRTVFRSDHSSNYFVLKGRLGRDKERMIGELRNGLVAPETEDGYNLRPEWARGL